MDSYSFHPIDEPESTVQLVFGSQSCLVSETTSLASVVFLESIDHSSATVSDDEAEDTSRRLRRKAKHSEGRHEDKILRCSLGDVCSDDDSDDSDLDAPQPSKRLRLEESDALRDARITLWRQCLKRSLFRPLPESQ